MAGGDLAQLVGAHPLHRKGVGLVVALDRDLRGHAAHRMRTAAVAGLDQQFRVGLQERLGHRHLATLRQHLVGVAAQRLQPAEDVVPATAVQADDAAAQRVQDLVHLEHGRQRFDQHRRLHRAHRQVEAHFEEGHHLVPQARFLHALHLRQVEVRAALAPSQGLGVVEREGGEVEQAAAHRLAVDRHVHLVEVPAARADDQYGLAGRVERVALAGLRRGEGQDAVDGVAQGALAGDLVGEGRRVAVLEVGHETVRARVQRVDDHLRVDRAGDLDAAVLQGRRDRRDGPVAFADRPGVGAEVRQHPGIELGLAGDTGGEALAAGRLEQAMQVGEQGLQFRRQDRGLALDRAADAAEAGRGRRGSVGGAGGLGGSAHGARRIRGAGLGAGRVRRPAWPPNSPPKRLLTKQICRYDVSVNQITI